MLETEERLMTPLSWFGLFAVSAMLTCYALEERHRSFTLLFAASCALGSVYGFLQGAWPFGLVEAVWSGVAVRKWWRLWRPNLVATEFRKASRRHRR
jgi:hypothetical protein